MTKIYSAITARTDAFSEKYLNEEYAVIIRRVIGALASKRPSPLTSGRMNVWAAAAVRAVGLVNVLDDPSQIPHCKPKVIDKFFGVAASTSRHKSGEIRDLLNMGPLSPEWTLAAHFADNTRVRMLQINGMVIDIRQAPVELQKPVYEKGLIPFIPGETTP